MSRLLLLIGLVFGGVTQTWEDYPLTLTTAIARFPDESPFEASDWLIELGEYTPQGFAPKIPLWGANAIAYPQWASAVRWSSRGEWLALTIRERQTQHQGILLYHLAEERLETLLPPEYSHVSPLSWAQNTRWAVFSADGVVYRVSLPTMDLETLTAGHFAVLTDEDQTLIFLNPDQQVSQLDLASGLVSLWDESFLNVTSLAVSPDSQWIALTQGASLTVIERAQARPQRLFEGGEGVNLDSVAWSPNSLQLAFVLTATAGEISQVVELRRADGATRVLWEASQSDDPRIVIGVTYQRQGAFIPPRENSDDV